MKLLSSRKDCLSFLLFCIDRVVLVVDWPAGGGVGLRGQDIAGICPASPTTTTATTSTGGEGRHGQ